MLDLRQYLREAAAWADPLKPKASLLTPLIRVQLTFSHLSCPHKNTTERVWQWGWEHWGRGELKSAQPWRHCPHTRSREGERLQQLPGSPQLLGCSGPQWGVGCPALPYLYEAEEASPCSLSFFPAITPFLTNPLSISYDSSLHEAAVQVTSPGKLPQWPSVFQLPSENLISTTIYLNLGRP